MGKNIFRSLLLGLVMVLAIQLVALAADNQFSGVQITVQMQDHSATPGYSKAAPRF